MGLKAGSNFIYTQRLRISEVLRRPLRDLHSFSDTLDVKEAPMENWVCLE